MREEVERLLEQDDFAVWSPGVQILEKSGSNIEQTRPIGGYCSTEDLDRQDEIVVAKGLDFSEFVAWGYYNDNHKQETAAVLGWPKLARLEKGRWWTEGNLVVDYPPADKIWELAKALKKSGAPRSLGFSIEGKVLERDNSNRIVRAKVRNVAITNCPVNTSCTWGILSKAFASEDRVNRAAHKALAKSPGFVHSESAVDFSAVHRRSEHLSFGAAMARVKAMRPQYSDEVCARLVHIAMSR